MGNNLIILVTAILIIFICTFSCEIVYADGFPLGYFVNPNSPPRGDPHAETWGMGTKSAYIIIGGCLIVIESVLLFALLRFRRRRIRRQQSIAARLSTDLHDDLDYLLSLEMTIATELMVFSLFGFRSARDLGTVIVINFMTHPLVFYALCVNAIFLLFRITMGTILFLEIFIILIEWLLLYWVTGIGRIRLLVTSFSANVASYLVGLIVFPPYSGPC